MESDITPGFNSSLQYLDQINSLIWSTIRASIDETTRKDEYLILTNLQILLVPRMTEEEEEKAEELRKYASKLSSKSLREYFTYLNRIAHAKGLIMKDTKNLPGVITG